tara:strand:+ start:172 stop:798 length:627 start_codon:yes stop_codon:yes gene_type:complete
MSYYAYYNEKFEVTMISNELDNTTNDMFIIIDEVMFLEFAEEKINYSNYAVIGGRLLEKESIALEKYTDSRIPMTLTDKIIENCMVVTQDKESKTWYAQAYFGMEPINNLLMLNKDVIEKKIYTFYVVSKDNRFILLDTLKVPAKNILTKKESWKQRGVRIKDQTDIEVFTAPAYTIPYIDKKIVTQDVRLLCRRDFLTYHHRVGVMV